MPSSIKRSLLAAVVPALLLPAGALAATKPENGAVAFSAKRAGSRVIYTRERDGTGLRLIDTAGLADHPAVSPRGKRVAFTKYGPWGAQVWVTYLDGTGLRRLTAGSTDTMPAWNPGGRDVVFASGAKGRRDIYRVIADGTGLRRLTLSRRNDEAPAWSVTNRIAFVRTTAAGDDIYTMSASGGIGAAAHAQQARRPQPGVVTDRPNRGVRPRRSRQARPLRDRLRRRPGAAPDRGAGR